MQRLGGRGHYIISVSVGLIFSPPPDNYCTVPKALNLLSTKDT